MELKPYFGLGKKGLTLLRRDHHKKLNTMVAHVDNTPFVPPESSPLRHKLSHLSGNNKRNKRNGKRKYAVQKSSDKQARLEMDGGEIEQMMINIEEQMIEETNNSIEPQQISYYGASSNTKLKCQISDTLVPLDRDQITISSSVLKNPSNRMKLKGKHIKEDVNDKERSNSKYTRLKNEKKRRKIQRWQQTFEMNGNIASKADIKAYENFIKLLIKLPTSSNRVNIIKMALDDASIAEGEALLLNDFC